MAYYEDMAQKLALDVMKAQEATGDDQLVIDITETLEGTSSTLHEAFVTAVRVYLADERARAQLTARLKTAGFEMK